MTLAPSGLDVGRMRQLGVVETPLLRLDRVAPPGRRIYAKAEWHQPTGSVKDRVAAAMVAAAERDGLLDRPTRLLEPSSGNTGIALARLARLLGHDLTVLVPDNVSAERVTLLEAFGAKVEYTPGAEGSNGAVWRAERRAAETGETMLHQYENAANPLSHETTTGPEIERRLEGLGEGPPACFVASLGTGGTLTGVARALSRSFPDMAVVAAEPPVGESIAGLRSMADGYVPPVFDPTVLDGRTLVRTGPAISMMRRLADEEGLFVGPSSGAAVHAAVKWAARLPEESIVVTLLPDAGWKYLSTGLFSGSIEDAEEAVSDSTLW
ncbi:MAG TPA: cysteine synthase family protein [Acidimicrobiia bacterium]|nr:cysteine synthase family protein [Acidimicrobiia bacterium]